MYFKLLLVLAILAIALPGMAQAERSPYQIEWQIQAVPATTTNITAAKGDTILSTRLLPRQLFKSTAPILSERGENLVDGGEWFVLANASALMACTPRILRKTKTTNRAGSRQVCVADTNGDNHFDSFFLTTPGAIQGILIQGTMYSLTSPATLSPLPAESAFVEAPRETEIGMPQLRIKYLDGLNFGVCVGSGMTSSDGTMSDDCVPITSETHWAKPAREFELMGGSFTVHEYGKGAPINLSLDAAIPAQPLVFLPSSCLLCGPKTWRE